MADVRYSSEGLATKTVKGSAYSIAASAATLVLGFGRSVLMARLLVPEDFGVVAFALTFLRFTGPLRNFGLDLALIHRQTDDESSLEDELAAHFSLRLILTGLFVAVLLVVALVLRYAYPQKPLLVPVLLGLTIGEVATAVGATPTTYLCKAMRFKELAFLRVLTSVSMTVVGPLMAWLGWGVWALVGEYISGVIVATLVVWIVVRPWHPEMKFDKKLFAWYLNYGKFVFTTLGLERVLDEFDDFWIGTRSGSLALGYYSKAYELALYPRRVISEPIANVVLPVFAKLQDNRLQLSQAYFRFSSLVTRVAFLLAGPFVLAANEFVHFFLGAKWMPMVATFSLMVVYVLLDPLLIVGANLVQAVGRPDFWTRARLIQGVFFVPAVIIGNWAWGINGVALATDIGLLIGLILLFSRNRELVDVSFKRMFGLPTLALLLGSGMSLYLSSIWAFDNQLANAAFKVIICVSVYSLILLMTEFKDYTHYVSMIWDLLTGRSDLQRSVAGSDDRSVCGPTNVV